MIRTFLTAAFLMTVTGVPPGLAENLAVTIEIREIPDDTESVILSAGVDEQEFGMKVSGTITLDLEFFDNAAYRAVVIQPKEKGDLDANIDVIICSKNCKPLALYFPDVPDVIQSDSIQKTCRASPPTLREHFFRYFFCRAQYRIFEQEGNENFKDAFFAIFGWFEAAYKLNETLRYKGYPIFPRDRAVEDKILRESDKQEFQDVVGSGRGYFEAMITSMEASERTKIQYAEYLKAIGREDLARQVLFDVGASAAANPVVLQNLQSGEEDAFVRGVFERELPRVNLCSLAGIC